MKDVFEAIEEAISDATIIARGRYIREGEVPCPQCGGAVRFGTTGDGKPLHGSCQTPGCQVRWYRPEFLRKEERKPLPQIDLPL